MKSAAEAKRVVAGRERKARREEKILSAATRLFARHGYADTDTQLLADTLKVGKGTIYRYFPSKEKLFLAAVDRAMGMVRKEVDDCIEGIADPLDRIAGALHASLAFFEKHPDFVELLMQERAHFKDPDKPALFDRHDAGLEPWRRVYGSLMEEGRIRNMPVKRITDVFCNLFHGTIFMNYASSQRKPLEQQAEDMLDIMFHGILSDEERERRRRRAAQPASRDSRSS
jgi:AcrR family transcriptional regulator